MEDVQGGLFACGGVFQGSLGVDSDAVTTGKIYVGDGDASTFRLWGSL